MQKGLRPDLSAQPASMALRVNYTLEICSCHMWVQETSITEGVDRGGGPVGDRMDRGDLEPCHGVRPGVGGLRSLLRNDIGEAPKSDGIT